MNRTMLLVGLMMSLTIVETPLIAQELRQRYDNKLAEEWLHLGPWTTDYDEARSRARETGKLIFGYFTASYAP